MLATATAEVHIPEPMVFDLVRGLGAKQGEFETDDLAIDIDEDATDFSAGFRFIYATR